MHGPFADKYWKANITEVENLEAMNAQELVNHTKDMSVLQSTQAFKLKHLSDGLIKKFKAQFCVMGDQQVEGNYFLETDAPVVQQTKI